jgi:hypothetical protein
MNLQIACPPMARALPLANGDFGTIPLAALMVRVHHLSICAEGDRDARNWHSSRFAAQQ